MPKNIKENAAELCEPCVNLRLHSQYGCSKGLVRHEQWSWAGKTCRQWKPPLVKRSGLPGWAGKGPEQMLAALMRKSRPKPAKYDRK